MAERKLILLVFSVIVYIIYNVHTWFVIQETNVAEHNTTEEVNITITDITVKIDKQEIIKKSVFIKPKNTCGIVEIFTTKPPMKCKDNTKEKTYWESQSLAVMGISVFLTILIVNAILDVISAREEERLRKIMHPEGERRQSLAEFANRKPLRRESSKFGQQLFQICEAISTVAEKKSRRENRPYTRGESTNSYLSEKNNQSNNAAPFTTTSDTPPDSRLAKRQSVARLFGARPAPMVRRCSFPALPLNPDVQAVLFGLRRPSTDSDDESDGKGRRVRLIRRY